MTTRALSAAFLFALPVLPAAAAGEAVLEALRSDLSVEVAKAAAAASSDPGEILARIAAAAPGYHFASGPVAINTDRRWFATLPGDEPGTPLFEARRWPGDTVLAVYPVRPGTVPEVAGLTWGATDANGTRAGELLQAGGRWSVRWGVREVPAAPAAIGILLLAGDGGLGREAREARLIEAEVAAGAVQVNGDLWRSVPVHGAREFALPRLPLAPEAADERQHGWQMMEAGGATLSLPPGLLARRTDLGVPAPRPIPGGVLWLRGRLTDRSGEAVVVGDGVRAGYVAEVPKPPRGWASGQAVLPLGVSQATLAAVEPFTLAADRVGVGQATAARWTEPGFAGAWLVFRLQTGTGGVEIGLPVLRGRTSPALFWIPVTYRPRGVPPAAPPIDPSDRLGMRFEPPLPSEARRDPTLQGRVSGPGFKAEVPKGWWPRANLRAADGFPLDFVDRQGKVWGHLDRRGGEQDPTAAEGWTPEKRPRAWGATAAWTRADGGLALRGEDGTLWRLVPREGADPASWKRLAGRLVLLKS